MPAAIKKDFGHRFDSKQLVKLIHTSLTVLGGVSCIVSQQPPIITVSAIAVFDTGTFPYLGTSLKRLRHKEVSGTSHMVLTFAEDVLKIHAWSKKAP